MGYQYTALITTLSLLTYFWTMFMVGRARGKFKLDAPATVGHPEFERVFRVHQNTLENFAMYLPGLWLFAAFVSDRWAAAIGIVWIVGRVIYARGYYAEASKRGTGFVISLGAAGVLVLGALIGIVVQMVR
jgi:glutathione S-transferase